MALKRQVIYREASPADGDIIEVDIDSQEYDLLNGKTFSTKFCWIEPVKGLKNGIVRFLDLCSTMTFKMLQGILFGFGFTIGALAVLGYMGVI